MVLNDQRGKDGDPHITECLHLPRIDPRPLRKILPFVDRNRIIPLPQRIEEARFPPDRGVRFALRSLYGLELLFAVVVQPEAGVFDPQRLQEHVGDDGDQVLDLQLGTQLVGQRQPLLVVIVPVPVEISLDVDLHPLLDAVGKEDRHQEQDGEKNEQGLEVQRGDPADALDRLAGQSDHEQVDPDRRHGERMVDEVPGNEDVHVHQLVTDQRKGDEEACDEEDGRLDRGEVLLQPGEQEDTGCAHTSGTAGWSRSPGGGT